MSRPTVHPTARTLFRESGYVTPTRTAWAWSWAWVWPVCGVLAVLSLFVLAGWMDQTHELQQQAAAQRQQAQLAYAFEQGRQAGHAELIATTQAAWQAASAEREHCATNRK